MYWLDLTYEAGKIIYKNMLLSIKYSAKNQNNKVTKK